jgi:hypothetical protein
MKKIVFILSLGLLFAACSEDDAAPIIDPATSDFYPLATFELVNPSSQGAAFVEADTDTILVNVTINEPIVYDSFFTAYPDSTNTATLGVDYEIIDMTIPAYQTTGQLQIVVFDDAFPEMDETVNLTVQPLEGSDGEQYDLLFDPATEYLQLSFTIEDNPTSTTALTAALKWNEDQAEEEIFLVPLGLLRTIPKLRNICLLPRHRMELIISILFPLRLPNRHSISPLGLVNQTMNIQPLVAHLTPKIRINTKPIKLILVGAMSLLPTD